MSDIQVVSADAYRNGWQPEGVVPYGTVFADDSPAEAAESRTMESFYGVPAVDWKGLDGPVPVVKKVRK